MAVIKTHKFLPEIFQTPANTKFLNATLDQLVSEPKFKKVNGYIGRKFAPTYKTGDGYVQEQSADRQNYQLEPSVVVADSNSSDPNFYASYTDVVNQIKFYGGNTTAHSRLFENEKYSYGGLFDLDKFVNFSQYSWLPNGPDPVLVTAAGTPMEYEWDVYLDKHTGTYQLSNAVNSTIAPTHGNSAITLAHGGKYKFNVMAGAGPLWIQSGPGADGVLAQHQNISSRDVFGVTNNGAESGTITFEVPIPSTQQQFIDMPVVASVDYAPTLQYKDLQGATVADINARLGGIDGRSGSLHNKTLIFAFPPSPADRSWETATVAAIAEDTLGQAVEFVTTSGYMPWAMTVPVVYISVADYFWTAATTRAVTNDTTGNSITFSTNTSYLPWGSTVVDGAVVTEQDRNKVWLISVNDDGIINLTPTKKINPNEQVFIKSGAANSTRHFYMTSTGHYKEVPAITSTLSTLYYQNGNIGSAGGIINLVAPVNNTLNPAVDITGKKTFTSPNGIVFTNGLKVLFDSSAPSEVAHTEFYVTGVGTSIKLVPVTDLIAIENWNNTHILATAPGVGYSLNDYLTIIGGNYTTPATAQVTGINESGAVTSVRITNGGHYTVLPSSPVVTSGGTGTGLKLVVEIQPVVHDYLTVNHASIDGCAWSRTNRWFHNDVVKYTATVNGTPYSSNQVAIAKRPIIEFTAGLSLFNHGLVAKKPINTLDTVVTDAYKQVENARTDDPNRFAATINGKLVVLVNGDRVIFSNDVSQLVRARIYNVQIVNISSDVTSPLYIVTIVEASDAEIVEGNSIAVINSDKHISSYWFDGESWVPAQQKKSANQAPLFDVYDNAGVSFGSQSKYVNSSFAGITPFNYTIGSGIIDSILGFSLSYRSFNNVGDIQFSNNFDAATFTYLAGPVTNTVAVNTGTMHITTNGSTYVDTNGWTAVIENSKQYQLISYVSDGTQTLYEIDILPAATTNAIPNVKVLVNGALLQKEQFGITAIGVRYAVVLVPGVVSANATVDILIYGSKPSAMGFYQVPDNLDNNSVNSNFTNITLGQMRNHLVSLYHNSDSIVGTVPGTSNLRDNNIVSHGGSILKHAAPVLYSGLFLVDQQCNFVEATKLAQREYSKFKNKFLELSTTLDINATDVAGSVDRILKAINIVKNASFPWYYSDMVPQGDSKVVLPPYTVLDPRIKNYEISEIFNDTALSNKAVLVYLTRSSNGYTKTQMLVKGRDFTFSKVSPGIEVAESFALVYNDVITVVEYSDTDGNYIPETPTKLGMYPKFVPSKYLDNTYVTPIEVIQGHDGSRTPAFGDYRDDLLLELELRIFNNIKIEFTHQTSINVVPGKFRKTSYSLTEYNKVLTTGFLAWAGNNRIDYASNTTFNANNPWTWNYSQFSDTIDGEKLPGSWRAAFMWMYDTDRPHTHPWEMLGFTEMPDWWVSRYGPAPYTGGNLTLWNDLRDGLIFAGPRAGIDLKYKRDKLLDIIPVDDAGNLLSPEKFMVLDFDSTKANSSYSIGEVGPAESAWRKSSEYPYAVQIATALCKPALFFGVFANIDAYKYNSALGQLLHTQTNQQITPTAIRVNGDDSGAAVIRAAGYLNWISDSLKNLGMTDPAAIVKQKLKNVLVQLSYKVAGYTDKKFLKILAEQGSPTSTNNSIIVPDENYTLLMNKSVPIGKVVYSAVIVEKSANGYTVSGYSQSTPYFTIVPSQPSNNAYSIVEENATGVIFKDYLPEKVDIPYGYEFQSTQQVVDFLVSYQRFLQSMGVLFVDYDQDLNQKRDWVLSAREFLTWTQQGWAAGNVIILSPCKDVVRVSTPGSVVDDVSNSVRGSKVLATDFSMIPSSECTVTRLDTDFTLSSITGSTIALAELNLVQHEHVIVFDNTTVFNDIIYSAETGNRQYRLKFVGNKTANWNGSADAAGYVYNNSAVDKWASGADYKKGQLVEYKNSYYVALANVVASLDFDPALWALVDRDQLKTGLLPGFATNAKSFESYYDVDNQPYDNSAKFYSMGLIGFRERGYLTDLLFEAETQSKFYQGFIKQKGSMNAMTALSAAEINGSPTSITINEEWAIRVGEYGATDSNQFVEVLLDEYDIQTNPAAMQVVDDDTPAESGAATVTLSTVYKASKNNSANMFESFISNDAQVKIPTAGYVSIDDVDATVYDMVNYRDLSASLANIGAGFLIWTAKDFNGSWNVYRVSESAVSITSLSYNMDNVATVSTNKVHGLTAGEIVAVKGFSVMVGEKVTSYDGFYQIYDIVDATHFTIVLATGYSELRDAGVINDSAILFKLSSCRVPDVASLNNNQPVYGWQVGDKIWVDTATANGWGVYSRQEPWEYTNKIVLNASEYVGDDALGSAVTLNPRADMLYASATGNGSGRVAIFAKTAAGWVKTTSVTNGGTASAQFGKAIASSNITVAISASSDHTGCIYVYAVNKFETTLVQVLTPGAAMAIGANYGKAVSMSDDGQWLFTTAHPDSGQLDVLGYAYQWVDKPTVVQSVLPGETVVALTPEMIANGAVTTDDIIISGENTAYLPGVDYVLINGEILFTTVLVESAIIQCASGYKFASTLSAPLHALTTTDSICANSDGTLITIGAGSDSTVEYQSGMVYLFDRSVETFVSGGTSNTFAARRGSPAAVLVNGARVTNSKDYIISGNSVLFTKTPTVGDVISLETNEFSLIDTLSATPTVRQRMGQTVAVAKDGATIFAGAPGYATVNYYSGCVYRYINQAITYGTITSTKKNPTVVPGHGIRINGTDIVFTSSTVTSVAATINSSGVSGVVASVVNGVLTISTTLATKKLNILPGISGNSTIIDLGLELYVLAQTVVHPVSMANEFFGSHVAISTSGKLLAVSSQGASMTSHLEIDSNKTMFDSGSTGWYDSTANSGAVYLYDLIEDPLHNVASPELFAIAQNLTAPNASSGMMFGSAVVVDGDTIVVGAANDPTVTEGGGALALFKNDSAQSAWHLHREAPVKVDFKSIAKAFLYDKNNNTILARLDSYDPAKGKLLGVADQDIDFITELDPAVYNSGGETVAEQYYWSDAYVGKVWWDLSQVRVTEYEQGSLDYRNKNWGAYFPSSTFTVCEWVESTTIPSEYNVTNGNGVPLYSDNSKYVVTTSADATGSITSKYYFWVTGKTTVDVLRTNRTNSVMAIQEILENPKSQDIPFIAAISSNAYNLFNVSQFTARPGTVLHLDHTPIQNTNIIHAEYEFIKENSYDAIPTRVVNKLQDSLSGVDIYGNIVPDPKLAMSDKFGIGVRPRQTMFMDRLTALTNFVTYANKILLSHPVVDLRNLAGLKKGEPVPRQESGIYTKIVDSKDELYYIPTVGLANYTRVLVSTDVDNDGLWAIYQWSTSAQTWDLFRIQSYLTSMYVDYVDWYDKTYIKTSNTTHTVGTYPELSQLTLAPGDTATVRDNGDGRFAIYKVNSVNELDRVASERGTIQFKSSLYDLASANMGFDADNFDTIRFDQNPVLETRDIFDTLVNDILIDIWANEFNSLFFSLVNYIFTESKTTDWIFKSSFVTAIHHIRDLAQYPSYIKDNQTYYENYINEVKPYRTTVREYLPTQSATDTALASVTDFDLPSYYDLATNTNRSPDVAAGRESSLFLTTTYNNWYTNYSYKVVGLTVAVAGADYTLPPAITIVGGGGSGATAQAVVNNGAIVSVIMLQSGTGYTSTPTVIVNGNGNGAVLVPVLHNEEGQAASSYNTIRGIDTSIKFDRIDFHSNVVEWKPNTTYSVDIQTAPTISKVGVTEYALRDNFGQLLVTGAGDNLSIVIVDTEGFPWIKSGNLVLHDGAVYAPKPFTYGWQSDSGLMITDVAGNTFSFMGGGKDQGYQTVPVVLQYFWQSAADDLFVTEDGDEITMTTIQSLDAFDPSQFDLVSQGNVLLTNNNRVMGYYAPSFDMPAKELTIVNNGLSYPGVLIDGNGNDDATAVNRYDTTITSDYTDISLGYRPEDINIDGGAYVDAYSSHAPEELLPGMIYEAVDIQVYTANTYNFTSDVFTLSNVALHSMGFGYDSVESIAYKQSVGVSTVDIVPINVEIYGMMNAVVVPTLAANGSVISLSITSAGTKLLTYDNPTINITGTNVSMATASLTISQDLYDLVGYRYFYGMDNTLTYSRIDAPVVLTKDLLMSDTELAVSDVSNLSTPNLELNAPGRIFINGELIIYYVINYDTNTLGQIRRGANGTGVPVVHLVDSKVYDAGENQLMPGGEKVHSTSWLNTSSESAKAFSNGTGDVIVDELGNILITSTASIDVITDGLGLMGAVTEQALFIKNKRINT